MTFRVDTALSAITLNASTPRLSLTRWAWPAFRSPTRPISSPSTLDRTYLPGEVVQVLIHYRHNNVADNAFYTGRGMVFTDCEPEGARKWFPCWDKPSDKATINIRGQDTGDGETRLERTPGRFNVCRRYDLVQLDQPRSGCDLPRGDAGKVEVQSRHREVADACRTRRTAFPIRFYWNAGESQTNLNNIKAKIVSDDDRLLAAVRRTPV